jgi:hypothetical protein
MNGRMSFTVYVAETRYRAVDHIMIQARAANRLAKIVAGPDQRRLYALKCGLLSRALELAPERLVVSIDKGLISIQNVSGVRLHAPVSQLTPRAQATVLKQIACPVGLAAA